MAVRKIIFEKKEFSISYDILNPNAKNSIVFLHGWGAKKEVMQMAFKDRLKSFRHIYIDLMGFGKSSNTHVLDTKTYSEVIESFLNELSIKKEIIVGHSFGGKIATLLEPKLLVLLSSAGILEPKPLSVKLKIASFKFLKRFGFEKFKKFFVASDGADLTPSMYEVFKIVVNEDFRDIFANSESESLVFWGKDDSATSLKSGELITSLIKNSKFYPLEGEHYFFLEHSDFISKEIGKKWQDLKHT